MADKIVLVEINYDTDAAIKNVNQLTQAIEGERVAQAKLKAELEAGTISQNEYSKQVEESKTAMNKANAERKNYINQLAAEKGSINEIKSQIKTLTAERDKLNSKTAEGKAAIKAYNAQLDALNQSLGEAKGKNKGFLGTLEAMPGPIGGIVQGFMGMTKAALAFIATPLGAVLAGIAAVIGGLFSVFKSFDPLLDKIGQAIAAVSAAFTWLKEAVIGLVTRQKEHNESMKDAIKAAVALKKAEQELEEQTVALTVANARSKRQIDELLLQSKDRTKSEKERIALIDKALKIEEEAYNKRKAIADKELEIAYGKIITGRNLSKQEIANLKAGGVEYAFQLQQRKGITDDEIKTLADALTKQEEILNESVTLREKAINRQNALEDKAKEEAEKRADAISKEREKREAERQKREEKLAEERMKQEQAVLDFKRSIAEMDEKLQLDLYRKSEEINDDLFDMRQDLNAEYRELEQEDIEARGRAIVEAADLERELTEQQAELRKQQLSENLAALEEIIAASQGLADQRVIIASDAFAKLSAINWDEVKDKKDAFIAIGNAAKGLTGLITAGFDRQFKNLEDNKNRELALAGENAEARAAIEATFAKKEEELKKQQAKRDKAKAIVDATIATALAVVNSLKMGLPLGLVFASIAGVLGGIQIASIASQPATYAKGGMIGGKPHSLGGTKFYGEDGSMFEAERGEAMFVLKKDATAEIAALGMINESFGGRSWTSAPAPKLAEGGEVATVPQTVDIEKQVDAAFQRTPIYVRVGDIETGMTESRNVKQAGVI